MILPIPVSAVAAAREIECPRNCVTVCPSVGDGMATLFVWDDAGDVQLEVRCARARATDELATRLMAVLSAWEASDGTLPPGPQLMR